MTQIGSDRRVKNYVSHLFLAPANKGNLAVNSTDNVVLSQLPKEFVTTIVGNGINIAFDVNHNLNFIYPRFPIVFAMIGSQSTGIEYTEIDQNTVRITPQQVLANGVMVRLRII